MIRHVETVKRKICIVTGTRADYGLLYWLMKETQLDPALELQIAVTGAHLSADFGLTYKTIEADGFTINSKIEMQLKDDSTVGVTKAVAQAVEGFSDAFAALKPDIIVVLGDRFEILAAAQAALFAKIPLAHIAGGDTTEGNFDEAIRHSVTKMAHLHFVTNEVSARRVRQLGEDPSAIFDFGSPGIDFIMRTKHLTRAELEKELDFKFHARNFVVTFHPVTLGRQSSEQQFAEVLAALDGAGPDIGLIFTKPNSDPDSRAIIRMIDEFVGTHSNAKAYTSLGQKRYLSVLNEVDAMIGNSSSGLYEMPSFLKPTVNIGDRQKGRLEASSVVNCPCEHGAIAKAIERALGLDCSEARNPYGDGQTSKKIKDVLRDLPAPQSLIQKHFFLLGSEK